MGAAYIKCLALDLKLWVQCAGWLVPTGPSSLSSALLTPQEADFYGPTTGPLTFCLLRVPRRRLHVFLASLCPPAGKAEVGASGGGSPALCYWVPLGGCVTGLFRRSFQHGCLFQEEALYLPGTIGLRKSLCPIITGNSPPGLWLPLYSATPLQIVTLLNCDTFTYAKHPE